MDTRFNLPHSSATQQFAVTFEKCWGPAILLNTFPALLFSCLRPTRGTGIRVVLQQQHQHNPQDFAAARDKGALCYSPLPALASGICVWEPCRCLHRTPKASEELYIMTGTHLWFSVVEVGSDHYY